MGMAVPVYYSADMVRALPDDGKRYETVHGELLVTPAPKHVGVVVLQCDLNRHRHRATLLLEAPLARDEDRWDV